MAISRRLRFEVLRRDDHTCRYCGGAAPDIRLTVDHVVPVTLGGIDEPSNLVAACQDCNSGKSSSAPDAELVAEVSGEALRWAAAQCEAAARLSASFAERDKVRAQFERAWNAHTLNGKPIEKPLGWRNSVDSILAAGLPIDLLIDAMGVAMGVAMGKEAVKSENVFRYMCGVAWRRVEKINADARTSISNALPRVEVNEEQPSVAELLVKEIAEYIGFVPIDGPRERIGASRCANDFVWEHGVELPAEYAFMFHALKQLIEEGEVMAQAAHRLLHLYDKEDIRQSWHQVQQEFEQNGFEHPTEVDYMHNITLHLERRAAPDQQQPPAPPADAREAAPQVTLGGDGS